MENTIDKSNVTDIWKLPFILTVVAVVYLLLLYYPTTESMVSIWIRSETFAHGFLILPISIWLIWQRKQEISLATPQPVIWAPIILLVGSFGWLLAYYVDVQVIQQLALISLIPLIVFTLLGWEVTKKLSFPLFFLVFAVPMGEGLVPTLIEFTADSTVALVKLTGIPIYREGNYFELPSGNWSVVEACSGVRYLIASITLGFLYAYLTYQTLWKRAVFVVASIIVPVFANGLRAFMIVMIGHFSDMQLATGVDHLVYGWLFFGIVIATMFYIGSFWREDKAEQGDGAKVVKETKQISMEDRKKQFIALTILLISVSIAPLLAYTESELTKEQLNVSLESPVSNVWNIDSNKLTDWHPYYQGVDAELQQTYRLDDNQIDLYIGYYAKQRQGAELITSTNMLVASEDEVRRSVDKGGFILDVDGNRYLLSKAIVRSGLENLLVVHFYIVNGESTTNQYIAKLYEAKARMFGGDISASIVSVATPLHDDMDRAELVLTQYLQEMYQPIREVLRIE